MYVTVITFSYFIHFLLTILFYDSLAMANTIVAKHMLVVGDGFLMYSNNPHYRKKNPLIKKSMEFNPT